VARTKLSAAVVEINRAARSLYATILKTRPKVDQSVPSPGDGELTPAEKANLMMQCQHMAVALADQIGKNTAADKSDALLSGQGHLAGMSAFTPLPEKAKPVAPQDETQNQLAG